MNDTSSIFVGLHSFTLNNHAQIGLSHVKAVHPDELDEEFDTFLTSWGSKIVRMHYDWLRSVAGRIHTVIGDLATQGEIF